MRVFVASDTNGQPDATIVGPYVSLPFPYRARDRHFVVAQTMTAAPAGTFDLGDPLDAAEMSRTLTNPEARALAQALDEPNQTYRGFTRSEAFALLLDHPSGARHVQSRYTNQTVTADTIGSIFTQTKPVL